MQDIWIEKYRPKTLDDVAGQQAIIERLKAYAKTKNVPHLIFAGPAGTGKTTSALSLAKEVFGKERVYGGVTAEGATLLDYGKIRHAGQGDTVIGPAREPQATLDDIITAFQKADFNAQSADNVDDLIWGKLIVNVGINALTAITRLKNGRLPELAGTRRIMEDVVREAVMVAKAKGVHLPYPDPLDRVIGVCRKTAGNIASMLQDVLNQKRTEVDFINGAIVREGERLGIPTPINQTLTFIVKTIQETYPERI